MCNRLIDLRPVSELVDAIREEARAEAQRAYERALEYAEELVKEIELNRQAIALLDAAGFNFHLPRWTNGSFVTLDLGFFPASRAGDRKLAAQLRKVWETLDCKLPVTDKDVDDARRKIVRITRTPADFPGIRVVYRRKLKAGLKCKIVHHVSRYSSLVCTAV